MPVYLNINEISLKTKIEKVGLTNEGAMEAPKDYDSAGWYELGPRPGEIGSAVIAGHVNKPDGTAAAFTELKTLKSGDLIHIKTGPGEVIPFVVRELKLYDAQADTVDVFNSNDGLVHLNLITCEGEWNTDLDTYSQRLVVFTDKKI